MIQACNISKSQIVESLLGEEVLTVVVASSVGGRSSSAPSASVAALTSENEVFIWGGGKGDAVCTPRKVGAGFVKNFFHLVA